MVTFTFDGRVHFKHLGQFTYHIDGFIRSDGAPVTTTVYEKPNGDTFTTLAPLDPYRPGLDPYVEDIVGGTGRFADASGTLTETFSTVGPDPSDPSNPLALAQTWGNRGTINY